MCNPKIQYLSINNFIYAIYVNLNDNGSEIDKFQATNIFLTCDEQNMLCENVVTKF